MSGTVLHTGSSKTETGSSEQSQGERWERHSHSCKVMAQDYISRNKLQVIMKEKVTTLISCNAPRKSHRWIGGSWAKRKKEEHEEATHEVEAVQTEEREKRRCGDWVRTGTQPSGSGVCIWASGGQETERSSRGEIVIWYRLWKYNECRIRGFGF